MRSGQGWAGQDKASQDRTGQVRTGQDWPHAVTLTERPICVEPYLTCAEAVEQCGVPTEVDIRHWLALE